MAAPDGYSDKPEVVTEVARNDGEPSILGGVVREPAERAGPITISKPKLALEEKADVAGAPVFAMTFVENKPYPYRGWVTDPRVDSFTLEFNNGLKTELDATTHPHFIAVLNEHRGSYFYLEDLTVVDITATDANGEVIE